MKFNDIKEAVTSQGFKFGFELECIKPVNLNYKDLNLPITFNETSDSSINIGDKSPKDFIGAEFVSEPLTLNPKTIVNVKQSIIAMAKAGLTTNSSCGFHIHYSYSNMTYADICWLLTNLSVNDEASSLFTEFEGIQFFDEKYANIEFLSLIKEQIESGIDFNEIFDTEKYNIIRIHPQGTMEWRGPRNFMNNSDLSMIDQFFIRLYKCADTINKLIMNKSLQVGSVTVNKNDFYKDVNRSDSNIKKSLKINSKNSTEGKFNPNQNGDMIKQAFKLKPELSKCTFKNILINVDSDIIYITGGSFSGKISGVMFDNCTITGSNLDNCHVEKRSIAGSKLNRCGTSSVNSIDCEFTSCYLKNTSMNMPIIDQSTLDGGSVMSGKIKNSKLIDAYIDDGTTTENCDIQ